MAHKRLGFMQLTILVGFSLYYAWYLIAFFGLFMVEPAETSFAGLHMGQVVFFGGTVIATLVTVLFFKKRGACELEWAPWLHLAAFALGLPLPAFIIVGSVAGFPPVGVFYLVCLLAGFSTAWEFMIWEDLSERGYLNRGALAHGTIFCAGGIAFLLSALLLTSAQQAVASMLLLAAATLLVGFIRPRCNPHVEKPLNSVVEYFRGGWHLDIVIAAINIAFGYAFILLYESNDAALLCAMGIAVFADMAFSFAFGRGKWVLFTGWARICMAVASCAFIVFVCPGEIPETIALCALVILWFLFRTMNGGSLTDLANTRDFPMLYMSTRGNFSANLGFMAGLALGVLVAFLGDAQLSRFYVPLALVAVFVIVSLLFMPVTYDSSTAGYKALAIVDMHEKPEDDLAGACETLTARFKLSPRESEVLAYLVRGRNAKHIAEKLYVSESTVKTHISNIYRKLGVHSQQELLDALDEVVKTL